MTIPSEGIQTVVGGTKKRSMEEGEVAVNGGVKRGRKSETEVGESSPNNSLAGLPEQPCNDQ